jgi:hypothetical protein
MSADKNERPKFEFPPVPTKPVVVDVIGGGDSDGLHFDTSSPDPGISQPATVVYTLTAGEMGRSMYGVSLHNNMRMARGEQVLPEDRSRQGSYYTVVKREDKDEVLRLIVQFTAGRNTWLKDEDGLKPGWVNTAIRRFIEAKFEGVQLDRMIMFWLCEDLRNSVGTAVEKSLIESTFGDGPLEAKCEKISQRVSKRLEKFDVIFVIGEEVIFFRPKPKPTP